MSSKPKFEVGEVVVLVSEYEPEKNGDYSVLSVHDGIHARTGDPTNVYMLCGVESTSKYWAESALRKKHLPGTLSFRDLMQTLKDPSKCATS